MQGGEGPKGGQRKTNHKMRAKGPQEIGRPKWGQGARGWKERGEGTLPARDDMRIGVQKKKVADHEGTGCVGRA